MTSSFTAPLDLRFLHLDDKTRIIPSGYVAPLRDIVWKSEPTGYSKTATVPLGFTCDGASIPFFLWPFIGYPLAPSIAQAAILHDWLYFTHAYDGGLKCSRRQADREFREGLKALGSNRPRRWVMWAGVRLFGFGAYRTMQDGDRIDPRVVADLAYFWELVNAST